jgi:ADP-ribose pyrophosphatase YjhB (NUDIX family)
MKFAPRDIFETILEWSVIPTFDLIIEIQGEGYLLVKRSIEPYKNQWALPGLRMYKGESIDETIIRIAKQEAGIEINPKDKVLVGQFVGKFKTENQRQDLSTGYYFLLPSSTKFEINKEHFSTSQLTYDIPSDIGAMYKYYIGQVNNS